MKKISLLKALAVASLPVVSTSYGVDLPVSGSVSSFNLALTVSSTVAGTTAKGQDGKPVKPATAASHNEWSITTGTGAKKTVTSTTEDVTKIQAAKYTTKEFLLDLVELGVLPSGDVTADVAIKGWSVVKVQATLGSENNLDIGPVKFYLVKKDVEPIELRGIIALDLAGRADAVNLKTVTKVVGETEPVTTSATTYAATLKQAGSLVLDLSAGEEEVGAFYLGGVYTGTQKLGATKAKEAVILSGAGKITSLTGFTADEDVVEGTATLGAGVATSDVVELYGANVLIDDEDVIDPVQNPVE